MRSNNRRGQRGNAIIEFAFCAAFLTPLLLGTFTVGMNLGRNIQATQVARDAGHMYVRWVKFNLPENQDLVVRLAGGLGMTRNGGNGNVILSQVRVPQASECAAPLTLAQCVNVGLPTISHRIVIGNAALRPSVFGTPPNIANSEGYFALNDVLTNPALQANGFGTVMTLATAETAFVSEAYFSSPDFDTPGSWTNTGVYARVVF